MSSTERNIHLGLLGASLALAVWVFGAQPRSAEPATHSHARSKATAERSPLSILPPGSAFVLSTDLRALARAPLGAFIAERLGRSAGTSKLTRACGFDPITRLDQLALAVPSAGLAAQEHPEDFGIVASGRFSVAEITRCATTAITARGGEVIRTKLGSFDSVRDRKASGEIAARDGLLIVSGGSYFRELLDSAEGNAAALAAGDPREASDTRHAELRRALGSGAVLATWLLGEGWFARVAGEDTNARLSPLSALKTVAARIDVEQNAELLVLLDCIDSDGARRIASLLGELRLALSGFPLDPTLVKLAARITVTRTEARLKLALSLNQAELSAVLDLLLAVAPTP